MEEKDPLVSVIIPTYNQKIEYLKEAVVSVIRQTYTNWELIIVDDGSTEPFAEEFSKTNPRIRIIRKENGGIASALNEGIKNMNGEWFAWLSSDDIWYPEKLEKQVNFAKGESDIKIIYTDWEYIDETGKHMRYEIEPEFINIDEVQFHLCHRFFGCGSSIFIHKSCFEKVGVFNEDYRGMEDYEMWIRLAKEYMFYKIPNVLMKYRSHMNALRVGFSNYGGIFHKIRNFGREHLNYDRFKVSAIVLGKNVQGTIVKCVHRLRESSRINEIIVINDGSTDKTQQKLEQILPLMRDGNIAFEVVRNKHSIGRGKARNMGLKKAMNSLILSVDGDIIPESGFLNRLTKIMDEDPFLDVVAGSVKWKSTSMGIWGEYYDFNITQSAKRQIGTALTLFKRSALERVGYLDDSMISGEDSEMFIRMQKEGIRFVKTSDLLGTHIEDRTLFEIVERHYQYGRDRYQSYTKHKDDMKGQYKPEELIVNPPEILQILQHLLSLVGTLGFRDAASHGHAPSGTDENVKYGGR